MFYLKLSRKKLLIHILGNLHQILHILNEEEAPSKVVRSIKGWEQGHNFLKTMQIQLQMTFFFRLDKIFQKGNHWSEYIPVLECRFIFFLNSSKSFSNGSQQSLKSFSRCLLSSIFFCDTDNFNSFKNREFICIWFNSIVFKKCKVATFQCIHLTAITQTKIACNEFQQLEWPHFHWDQMKRSQG